MRRREHRVNSGFPEPDVEHFRSLQLVPAAKAAYEVLKSKRERIDRLK